MRFGMKKVNRTDVTKPTSPTESPTDASHSIPVANVKPNVGFANWFSGVYMWLVALGCLIVAIGVAWWSLPQRGVTVEVHFPDGHGLEAEDAVRFRGIDVGIVEKVSLNSELSGVDVTVNLLPFAEPLAREGTRFWIVRPEFGLSGVSGLETAVGHKYIGLIPGAPQGAWQSEFEGLSASPADALESPGIEIVLRSQERHSVTVGSPLSYRGVIVGRILSVGLSQDGRFVDVRARIFDKYSKLATSMTKFWASSGIDLSGSITKGINFQMESLETLARGGIAMLTIENGGTPIQPGDDFVLYAEAEPDWYEKAQQVQATDKIYRRGALPMEVIYMHDGFLGDSERRIGFVGVHAMVDSQPSVLIPTDMLTLPNKGIQGSLNIGMDGLVSSRVQPAASTALLTPIKIPGLENLTSSKPLAGEDIRTPLQVERCLAIRAIGKPDKITYMHYPIEIIDIDNDWTIKSFSGDRNVWHGAPVLSEKDGRLIGILMVESQKVWIEMPPKFLSK